MSFELNIAVRRDPLEGRERDEPWAKPGVYTAITLNGIFDAEASQVLLRTVAGVCGEGADSILIDMEDVSAPDQGCLDHFAAGLMSLRSGGRHVQVNVHQSTFHARMSKTANSRDWLLTFSKADALGSRHAIHVDSPHPPG
jgi:anti-anti-sigma regulatory factor